MSGSYFMLEFLKKDKLKKQQTLASQNTTTCHTNATKSNTVNENKCRICLREGIIPIFDQNFSVSTVVDTAEAIRIFGNIEIRENDDLPKHLCTTCNNFLQNAVRFRGQAQETDKLLRQGPNDGFDNDLDTHSTADTDDLVIQNKSIIQKSYNCKLCKVNFKSFDELILHKNSKAHKKVRVQCPVCSRLLTAQLYKNHMVRHQSVSHLVCDICGKLYRKDNLVRHLQLHSFELPFQCQICPYRGRFIESLKLHMKTHTGEKPFSCDKCELRFLTKSNLNRHLLTHNKDRPFKCVECGRGFYTKRDMDVHFKADHAGLKEFSCRMCGNKYGTRKALMRHELRVHKRDKMAKGRMPLYLRAEYQKQCEDLG